MSIGENIRICRGAMKQSELAERLGVTVTTLSRWENGQYTLNAEMIQKIADILEVPTERLLKVSPAPQLKEVNERSLREDRGMMIYRFNENEVLELPATADFIPLFKQIVADRLNITNSTSALA